MKDQDRIEWPLIQLLNELLKPIGFRKMGKHWRKDAEDAVLALVLDNQMGTNIFAIRFGAWLKALGAVAVKDVRPILYRTHLYMSLIDPCPNPLKIKIFRALHFNVDYFDVAKPGGGLLDDALKRGLKDVDTSEPLTDRYRVDTIREAMKDYCRPVMERMETAAGLKSVLEQADLMKAADETLFQHFDVPIVDNGRLTLF